MQEQKKSPLILIFVTVFLYLVGFGVMLPIIPMLSLEFGASSTQVGLLMSVYSLMQFVFSPFWGRLSDRWGRRPILLFCIIGEVFAYILFALSDTLWGLFVARALAGFFGASISTASAYISDVTSPQERSKGMALIGAAFGLGFVFGPALGGGLTWWGSTLSSQPHFGSDFAAYFVATLYLLTFVFAWKFLKESLGTVSGPVDANRVRLSRWQRWKKDLKNQGIASLVGIFFVSTTAMAMMESSLILLVEKKFDWGIREVSFGFAFMGVLMVLSQGLLVRRLLPVLGERRMLVMGLSGVGVGLLGIAMASSVPQLSITIFLLVIASSFVNPSVMGSVSLLSNAQEQGEALGTAQSAASLGRIVGPATGAWAFGNLGHEVPFALGSSLAVAALLVAVMVYSKLPHSALKTSRSSTL